MKYVALLSGGKDSCYNLVHCARNGHELVAAASLRPESGKEEIDSYLYQTVGQDAIEFVARALEVPLYRGVITGNAVAQGSEYGGRSFAESAGIQGDETEDLFELLSSVKSRYPDIEAVSVGAILSNYQRVRVEHVCQRLGLTPLCYLWQRNQTELLAEMVDAGMEAILIKVAGIGLTTKHLGKTLGEIQPTLLKLHQLYGSHVCGEGGEYESLTLDCPLFKHRIKLTDVETVIHSNSDFATVAYLRIKGAVLEPKVAIPIEVAVPSLLEDDYLNVNEAVSASQRSSTHQESDIVLASPSSDFGVQVKDVGPWVTVANIQRSHDLDTEVSIEEEMLECFQILRDRLNDSNLQIHHCTNINIFLASIDLFARVNVVYKTFFGVSPPARACVAVDLTGPVRVRLDCIALREGVEFNRRALHVQGLSYWAPANIGPYSQAVHAQEWIFISGQIGLIPSSLSLPSPANLAMETSLACQHVQRVINAVKFNSGQQWSEQPQLHLYWLTSRNDIPHIRSAHRRLIKPEVPTLFLVVRSLPKSALVEKQTLFHTGLVPSLEEGEISMQNTTQNVTQGNILFDGSRVHWQVSQIQGSKSLSGIICIRGNVPTLDDIIKSESCFQVFHQAQSIRLFHTIPPHQVARLVSELESPCTPVPCHSIATLEQGDWDYAVCVFNP